MENKAIDKPRTSWPSLFDRGWVEKILNSPMDDYFNVGKMMNVPAVNVSETDKEFRLSIAAAGLEKSDFKIEAEDDILTISAEHEREDKDEQDGRYNRREYNYTRWSRSFSLPENVDLEKINAEYKNGELKVVIPKRQMKEPKKAKSISVK